MGMLAGGVAMTVFGVTSTIASWVVSMIGGGRTGFAIGNALRRSTGIGIAAVMAIAFTMVAAAGMGTARRVSSREQNKYRVLFAVQRTVGLSAAFGQDDVSEDVAFVCD